VFDQVPPAEHKRLGLKSGQDLKTPVHLDCGACHQLDGVDYGKNRDARSWKELPPRTSGALMLPIRFQDHCAACHPLQFDSKIRDRQVRHGQSPAQVLEELESFYTGEALKDDPRLLRRAFPLRPMPGPKDPAVEQVGKAKEGKVLTAVRMLFGSDRKGCMKCHDLTPQPMALVTARAIAASEIVPVNVPELWFPNARFDHSAHHAVNCEECHTKARGSSKANDLLLPKIKTCRECHRPQETFSLRTGVSRGVDDSCVECHRYHDGDHPRHGSGARALAPEALKTIQDFVQGFPRL
jgi:hypothetical protein